MPRMDRAAGPASACPAVASLREVQRAGPDLVAVPLASTQVQGTVAGRRADRETAAYGQRQLGGFSDALDAHMQAGTAQ